MNEEAEHYRYMTSQLAQIAQNLTELLKNRFTRDDKLVAAIEELADSLKESSATAHPGCLYNEDCVACVGEELTKIIQSYRNETL